MREAFYEQQLSLANARIEALAGALRGLMSLGGPGYPYGPALKRKHKAAMLRAERALAGEVKP